MPIQWFPGHMHTTRQAIGDRLTEIDVVIELLDARLPGSSANPLLAEMTRGKPALKVLNKQDLADPELTSLWLAHYQAQAETQALGLDASATAPSRQLVAACRALAPLRGGMVKPLRVLICGIPNVGKSTLINTLMGRRSAKTGDEPGITKTEQKLVLASDVYLFDTPGMLWPRITVEQSGYHLAASSGIGRNAYDEEEVAMALLASVRPRYGQRLRERYKLADIAGLSDEALLADIGRKRGGLLPGGRVNMQKAAEVAINDFRTGSWGRISLETPEQFAQWWAQGQEQDAQRAARREALLRKKAPGPANRAARDAGAASHSDPIATDGSAGDNTASHSNGGGRDVPRPAEP